MKKRTFIKVSSIAAAGSLIIPMVSCGGSEKSTTSAKMETATIPVFELPALGFGFDALAPNIDERTMQIHHGKHHAGYVSKFNAALEGQNDYAGKSLEEMMAMFGPDDTALRNNGGGHYNHSLFWELLSPSTQEPKGDLLSLLNASFGSFDNFKEQFSKAATGRFGSGWAWLTLDKNKKAAISSTPNQDNPLMSKIVGDSQYPLLGLDVWEHAYYLNYQNRRGDYVSNFFNIINWDGVAARFLAVVKG
jgi:Fe-Mn family superoxide dismutase